MFQQMQIEIIIYILQNTLAQEYPDNLPNTKNLPVETTLGGNVLEVAKGIPRGLDKVFINVPRRCSTERIILVMTPQ